MSKAKRKYKVRVYVFDNAVGNVVNSFIRLGVLRLQNSFEGKNGVLAIYDVISLATGLQELSKLGVYYFPLDNYGDFIITCPCCGERIDDDMILNVYDENLLSGYNINCWREECGTQMAQVEFIPQE